MAIKKSTKRLAVCAMLSAVSVVLLYLGAVTQVLDMTMAVLASLCTVVAIIEYGGLAPWLVYAVSGVLSFILCLGGAATPEVSIMYILFFGFYPILKEKLEKKKRWVSWVLKEIIFNLALCVLALLSKLLFTAGDAEPLPIVILFFLLAEIAFPLYDVALTRLITVYIFKIRPKIKFK